MYSRYFVKSNPTHTQHMVIETNSATCVSCEDLDHPLYLISVFADCYKNPKISKLRNQFTVAVLILNDHADLSHNCANGKLHWWCHTLVPIYHEVKAALPDRLSKPYILFVSS